MALSGSTKVLVVVIISVWVTSALLAIHRVKPTWPEEIYLRYSRGAQGRFCLVIVSTPDSPTISQ